MRRPRIDERVVIYPLAGPSDGLDVTDALVNALANAIGQSTSGNCILNRLEAELQLRSIVAS